MRKAEPDLFGATSSGAVFSPDGVYRYELTRQWVEGGKWCVFCMLNPSTADETTNDPTIRRCIEFSKRWGFGGLIVVNLFGLRATDPRELYKHPDPIGPENERYLAEAAEGQDWFVCAWGVHGALNGRGREVLEWVRELGWAEPRHLGLTKDGHPKHPLYLRADTRPVVWPR